MASSAGGEVRVGPGEEARVGEEGSWRWRASRRGLERGEGREAPQISQVEREGWFWNVQRGQEVEPGVEDGALERDGWEVPSL